MMSRTSKKRMIPQDDGSDSDKDAPLVVPLRGPQHHIEKQLAATRGISRQDLQPVSKALKRSYKSCAAPSIIPAQPVAPLSAEELHASRRVVANLVATTGGQEEVYAIELGDLDCTIGSLRTARITVNDPQLEASHRHARIYAVSADPERIKLGYE